MRVEQEELWPSERVLSDPTSEMGTRRDQRHEGKVDAPKAVGSTDGGEEYEDEMGEMFAGELGLRGRRNEWRGGERERSELWFSFWPT